SSSDATSAAAWASDQTGFATVTAAGLVQAVAKGRATVSAKIGAVTGVAVIVVTDATLTKLAILPANVTLPAGTAQRLRAVGSFSDLSSRDVSADATWSVSDPTLATVDALGNTTGLSPGAATVTAALSGKSASAQVKVTDATLTQILLLPLSLLLPVGDEVRLAATGIYTDNSLHDITETATWTSADATVASVSNTAGARGTVAGVAVGVTGVTAALDGVTSAPTSVNVTGATLLSLRMQPPQQLLPVYQYIPLRLFARYSDGSEQDETAQATFTSDNPGVANVIATGATAGVVTGVSAGNATITGTLGGKSATSRFQIVAATVQQVQIVVQRDSLAAGDSEQARCMVTYQGLQRAIDETPICAWNTSDTNIAHFQAFPFGYLVATSPGDFTAAAQVQGVTGTRQMHVTQAVPTKIEVLDANVVMPVGITRGLVAKATYANGQTADLTYGAEWSSDNNAAAAVGNQGLIKGVVTGVSPGVAHISATVAGVTGSNTVTVTTAKPTGLTIAPLGHTVQLPSGGGGGGPGGGGPSGGGPVTSLNYYASATYDDGSLQDVTATVVWGSSDPDVCTVSNSPGSWGRADVFAVGIVTIKATFGAFQASTTLTVR
ncbi:MAG: Ig-like domain-containing protein, partial [Deltaproteobacteria bacterium]|nr:Ig-like domain-containing protein [Deltaproteobacteria bacterium]